MSFASARLAAVAWHSRGVSHHGHARQHACSSPQSIPWSMRIESPAGTGGVEGLETGSQQTKPCCVLHLVTIFYFIWFCISIPGERCEAPGETAR